MSLEYHGISIHRQLTCLFNRLYRFTSRKILSKYTLLVVCEGNHGKRFHVMTCDIKFESIMQNGDCPIRLILTVMLRFIWMHSLGNPFYITGPLLCGQGLHWLLGRLRQHWKSFDLSCLNKQLVQQLIGQWNQIHNQVYKLIPHSLHVCVLCQFNSLALGRCGKKKRVMFNFCVFYILSISYETLLRKLLHNKKSIVVHVRAWWHQAPSHYLQQCLPTFLCDVASLGPNELNIVYVLPSPLRWCIIAVLMNKINLFSVEHSNLIKSSWESVHADVTMPLNCPFINNKKNDK